MSTGKLVCGQCGHEQPIDSRYKGQWFACPACGKAAMVIVPEDADRAPMFQPLMPVPRHGEKQTAAATAAASARDGLSKIYSAGRSNPLIVTTGIDALLSRLRLLLIPAIYNRQSSFLVNLAQYIILVMTVITLITGCILAIRINQPVLVLGGFLAAALVLFLQYVACKFLEMIEAVHRGSVLNFSGPGIFHICSAGILFMSVFGFFACIASLFGGASNLLPLDAASLGPALWGGYVVMLLYFYFVLHLFLHPEELLGVQFSEKTTGGEDFLSLAALGIKVGLKLTPVLFGLGCLISGLFLLHSAGMAIFNENALSSLNNALASLSSFVMVLCLPAIVYLVSILMYFMIDFALAVFRTARNTLK
jgi:hypothetical protein